MYSGPKKADYEVFDAYGDHKSTPKNMMAYFDQFFQSEDAVDPQIVVAEIARLVDMERGTRPVRVVSGIDYGTAELNERVESIQESVVRDGLQMGHLLELT